MDGFLPCAVVSPLLRRFLQPADHDEVGMQSFSDAFQVLEHLFPKRFKMATLPDIMHYVHVVHVFTEARSETKRP